MSTLQAAASALLAFAVVGLVLVQSGAPILIQVLGGLLLVGGAFGELIVSAVIVVRFRFLGRRDD